MIVVSHSVATIRKNCDCAAVLHNGELTEYENLDEALRVYTEICYGKN